ncbi:MAG: IS110 family transposase [Coprothermobacterota bacterium]|nr:IS110 family transposase [Coprothermobacterota bacterium]
MEVVHPNCCGLDVHKKTVVACLITTPPGGRPSKEIRTFGTMTGDLLDLKRWLEQAGCTDAAMESTGVYWKPIFNVLEGAFGLLVVNAQHLKAVPGRKTDVKDAEWIADLLRHGLLQGSFIPAAWQRELRDLTRYRTTLVEERARTIARLQKVLEDTNLKLASVATDITGKSARAMLAALLHGESDPARLAELACGRMREKRSQLEKALHGNLKPHHRFLLADILEHLDYLENAVERTSREIEERMRPFAEALARLDTIKGISRRIAEIWVAEVGPEVSRFSTVAQLASWAGICPGNAESAGKHKSGKIRRGNPWLMKALVEAAHAAGHSKDSYLSAQYHRLSARRGKRRAIIAVAHSILVIAYCLLKRKDVYQDLGGNYFDQRDSQAVRKRLVGRLEQLGFQVTLAPALQPA